MIFFTLIVIVMVQKSHCGMRLSHSYDFSGEITEIKDRLNLLKHHMREISNNHPNDKFTPFEDTLKNVDSNVKSALSRLEHWDSFLLQTSEWYNLLSRIDTKLETLSRVEIKTYRTDTNSNLELKLDERLSTIESSLEKINTQLSDESQQDFSRRFKQVSVKNEFCDIDDILGNFSLSVDGVLETFRKKSEELGRVYELCKKMYRGLENILIRMDQLSEGKNYGSMETVESDLSTTLTPTTEIFHDKEIDFTYCYTTNTLSGVFRFKTPFVNYDTRDFNTRLCEKGWTVIQRRDDYLHQENFNRSWHDYKLGFGKLQKDFWFGNDFINLLSTKNDLKLRIELENFDGFKVWAEYDTFKVSSEEDCYKLEIDGYNGTASDSFSSHKHSKFSTYDKKNDEAPICCPCAVTFGSGWWFNSCFESNLNGPYYKNPLTEGYYKGIIWENWLGNYSLKKTKMMVKPRGYPKPFKNLEVYPIFIEDP